MRTRAQTHVRKCVDSVSSSTNESREGASLQQIEIHVEKQRRVDMHEEEEENEENGGRERRREKVSFSCP